MKVQVDMTGLQKLMADAFARTGDLTVPLTIIKDEWLKGNMVIESMKSAPALWKDLSPKYKRRKESILGSAYPMMVFSGRLIASIAKPGTSESIAQIVGKQSLILGTKVPYAKYHQEGTATMPRRPIIVFGAEQIFSSSYDGSATTERIKRWSEILESWIINGKKEKT